MALKNTDARTRATAAYALGVMGPRASKAVPGLTANLTDGDADVRGWAAFAIGNIGAAAKAAVPSRV